ncbi:MAG: FUSC family protein, partial [Kineosporiaceae bacterium]
MRPRGVLSGFGAALDEAYAAGADRLRRIVLVLTGAGEAAPGAARRVATARRRLDDAFRLFLAERGTQRVPLRDATNLAAAATRLRLPGDGLADLAGTMPTPVADGVPETRLREAAGALDLWYRELGDAVAG